MLKRGFGVILLGIFVSLLYTWGQEEGQTTKLTPKEALDRVLEQEFSDWDDLVEVTFYDKYYEEDYLVGYKLVTEKGAVNPKYLTLREYINISEEEVYGWVMFAGDIYGSGGMYWRTETYNEFAVNMNTGDIIVVREYDENGIWGYSEEYRETFCE